MEVVEIGGEKGDKRQDSGDGNMAVVVCSAFVHFEEFGVELAGLDDSGSVDFAGGEGVKWGVSHASKGEGLAVLFEEFYANEGVFSSAEEEKGLCVDSSVLHNPLPLWGLPLSGEKSLSPC